MNSVFAKGEMIRAGSVRVFVQRIKDLLGAIKFGCSNWMNCLKSGYTGSLISAPDFESGWSPRNPLDFINNPRDVVEMPFTEAQQGEHTPRGVQAPWLPVAAIGADPPLHRRRRHSFEGRTPMDAEINSGPISQQQYRQWCYIGGRTPCIVREGNNISGPQRHPRNRRVLLFNIGCCGCSLLLLLYSFSRFKLITVSSRYNKL